MPSRHQLHRRINAMRFIHENEPFDNKNHEKKDEFLRAAGDLASGLLKGIPIAFIKTPAGYVPLADAVDIVEIISVTGEPGRRRVKLKIRRKQGSAGND